MSLLIILKISKKYKEKITNCADLEHLYHAFYIDKTTHSGIIVNVLS